MSAKISLVARKGIRDNYNAKKDELVSRIKEYTGEDYEFIVSFEDLWQKVDQKDDHQTGYMGSMVFSAYEYLTYQIGEITQKGEDEMSKEFFNNVLPARKINVVVDDLERGYYATCRIKDGVLELVWKTGFFGSNTMDIARDLKKVLDTAYQEGNKGELPLAARQTFNEYFLAEKDKVEEEIAEELLGTKLELVVDPAEIWRVSVAEYDKLKKDDKSQIDLDSIAQRMGSGIMSYFKTFLAVIRTEFKQDDLMVEGFLDMLDKKQVVFQVVPHEKLVKRYNEGVYEDGAYVMRTEPRYWCTNTSDCAIQDCIQKNRFDESKCQEQIDALYACCAEFYRLKGRDARSVSCPKPNLLDLKIKQRKEERENGSGGGPSYREAKRR
ncbi:hypothetical protein H072_3132 [Dactylellina haptotyla CBS 200.50]|uniref:Cx9C motif-containing protein 4, mitochondrial n=1 Tax=Dactylellina haptotyla (strain CBS 200.50) TaxID=1284197 RepID=S8BTX4_DACHA|nr:hypothetical protein H072_3132 [Dactylellina haptotyla CBS 200.50]